RPGGRRPFLHLMLHHNPYPVAGAGRAAAAMRARMLTIHAGGGEAMIRAAVDAARDATPWPAVLAVTVLTSMDDNDLQATGVNDDASAQVERLAALALDAGVDGLVCSPHEIAKLRERFGPQPRLVVPGIRPIGAALGDQKRTLSPAEAVRLGADVLVVGRPITEAAHPAEAAESIRAEIAGART
ncbi:MAG: orotidine-5'-phosphate decarboxylase, partial [Geminicoccaceae bacterium]